MTEHKIKWSHSSLKAYETCPRRYHEETVLKNFPRVETESMRYGTEVHAALEGYVNGTPIPDMYSQFKPVVDALLAKPGRRFPEMEMAVTAELHPCDWKSPQAWARGISDLTLIDDDALKAIIVDFKTGNNKYPDRDQLVLMSLLTFAHFPHIMKINSALLFIVKGTMVKMQMRREQADQFWWKYRERVACIEASYANNVWNPKQSGLCKAWCPILSCEFNGKH